MQLGDTLGFAGLLMALVGIALTYLAPQKKWIGKLCLGAAFLVIVCWVFVWLTTKKKTEKRSLEISWSPSSLHEDEPLTAGQLNAIALVDGKRIGFTAVYNPTFGTTLNAGTHTLQVTMTPEDKDLYLPNTRTLSVFVIAHPPIPAAPRNPLVVTRLTAKAAREVGGVIEVTIQEENISSSPIESVGIRLMTFAPIDKDSKIQQQNEDLLWKRGALDGLKTDPDIEEVPIGSSYRTMKTPPLTQEVIQDIVTETASYYFFEIVRERRTGRTLVERCAYLDSDLGVRMCHEHNRP